jgi:hypothetical protein
MRKNSAGKPGNKRRNKDELPEQEVNAVCAERHAHLVHRNVHGLKLGKYTVVLRVK